MFSNETEFHVKSFKTGYKYIASHLPASESIHLLLASNTVSLQTNLLHYDSVSLLPDRGDLPGSTCAL